MRVEDHFRIGSITKTFTATLLLILADEKKLGLDDPVSKYVAWVPNGDRITLRMLADMTAGLHSYTQDDAWVKVAFSNFGRVWTPRELVDVGLRSPPDFPPGQGWHYSNTNYVLLGMILEQVTGKKIQDSFAEKMFKPLKLTQTSWPVGAALPKPYAHGTTVQTLDDNARRRDQPQSELGVHRRRARLHDGRSAHLGRVVHDRLARLARNARAAADLDDDAAQQARACVRNWHRHRPWLARPYGRAAWIQLQRVLSADKKAVIVVMVNSDIPADKANPAPTIMKALAQVVTPGNVPQ
jgi:CubicO group peptidase (beta-lactamase class C family)